MSKVKKGNLSIDSVLVDFIEKEAIPGTDTNIENFWKAFDAAVHELAPINKRLIDKRESIQKQIDDWHLANKGKVINKEEYFKFLKSINYIVEEKEDFKISTANVDDEIAQIAGPQLVVPIDNARYALNAANARWGSLYDALYGTDVIPEDGGATKSG
ncbi:MAG: malate synthase G, partial [Pelagibacteraceae bacterium]